MNLVDRLLSASEDRVALVTRQGSWTYGELAARSADWRGAMAVGEGDRVVVLAGNDEIFLTTHLAVIGSGAVLVPLNPQSPPAELARELTTIEPAAAVVARQQLPAWEEAVSLAGLPTTIDVHHEEGLDAGEPTPIVSVAPATPAAMLYTSGTGGMPKPAVLTHDNLDASLRSVLSLPIDLMAADHVALGVIPLSHVFGFNAIINLGLAIGATLVLEDYSGPGRLAELVETHGITVLGGPPALWQALVGSDEIRADQFATVSLALSGAAKLPPAISGAIASRLGIRIDEGYGLTETCAMATSSVGTDAPIGSVGRLLPGFEARLVAESGGDVLVGDPGEIWLKGPMISPGYFPDEPRNQDVDDGWLRTGDVAIVDDDGYLAIVDRLKDIVIVSGFNVYPGEIESVLRAHPDVADAGVVGEDHPTTGEMVVAYVVLTPDSTSSPDSLIDYCRSQLARYKVPGRIEIRDQLPIGAIGKLRRRDLHSG